jgi:hypothetical protein
VSRPTTPRRLRIALYAYPRGKRESDGEVLTSLAEDMIDSGLTSINRESLGMIRGGIATRFGGLADAPWASALHRVSLWIGVALFAITLGAFAFWQEGLAWPGWSLLATVVAPGAVLFGLLTGIRWPLALGALLLCLLGVAQGNSLLPAVRLDGLVHWPSSGLDMPFLACALPAGVVLLACSLTTLRPAPRSTVVATAAWVAAGAIPVYLLYPMGLTIVSLSVTMESVAVPMFACVLAAITAFGVGLIRRHRDPAAMLAGVLGLVTVLPTMLLYGIGFIPLGENLLLILFALSAIATTAFLIRIVRLTPN